MMEKEDRYDSIITNITVFLFILIFFLFYIAFEIADTRKEMQDSYAIKTGLKGSYHEQVSGKP